MQVSSSRFFHIERSRKRPAFVTALPPPILEARFPRLLLGLTSHFGCTLCCPHGKQPRIYQALLEPGSGQDQNWLFFFGGY